MNSKDTLKLTIPFVDFKLRIDTVLLEAQEIISKTPDPEEELSFKNAGILWLDKLNLAFDESFNQEQNYFKNIVSSGESEHIVIYKLDSKSAKQIKEHIKSRVTWLEHSMVLLSISDAIINRDSVDFEARKKWTVKEKQNLILEKLYQVYHSDHSFEVKDIFQGNGIPINRHHEELAIAKILEDSGLIEDWGGGGYRLTTKGALRIEEKIESDDFFKKQEAESNFNEILKEIKDELEKSNCGNEILYEELQEIKEVIGKVPKKNLFEMIKGKVFDLTMKEVISKETAVVVYEKITGEKFNIQSLIQSTVNAVNNAVDWTKQ